MSSNVLPQRSRKGDDAAKDAKWPYHVAFRAKFAQGTDWLIVHEFCKHLRICDVQHSVRRNGIEYLVYRFADRAEAQSFRERFDGEFVDPKEYGGPSIE